MEFGVISARPQRSTIDFACAKSADTSAELETGERREEAREFSPLKPERKNTMAACPKCGKHLKRRRGVANCRRCGTLPTLLGDKLNPPNPFGSCFDSAAYNFVANKDFPAVMCHGVGISNHPESMGQRIAHAWIELDHKTHGRIAIDPIWLIAIPAEKYRHDLSVDLCLTYTLSEFIALWKQHDHPGPFDGRIREFTTEGKAA